ncbi:MAG: hypothetical protein IKT40_07445 [Bacilli bacterium]|nr:hypothetical protein [Bacilli bacterium]
MEVKDQKEYREERFEFSLFINNNLICKRNFKINNYIDGSMQSLNFKDKVDEIVQMIDDDLKSKSRVYTWFYFDETNEESNEFTEPLIDPWECTFKFVVTDNKKEVISKIWDGRGYPKQVRDKVDIANKTVKVTTRSGQVLTFDKDAFFAENNDRLTIEQYILKAQIFDKPDLLIAITKKICEVCSPRENSFQKSSDYNMEETYGKKEYKCSLDEHNKAFFKKWEKACEKKTKKYFANLFN